MKLAIVGSREYKDKLKVWAKLEEYTKKIDNLLDVIVISGGARGVDTWAVEWAKARGIYTEIIRPIEPNSDKLNYLFRNVEIIAKADEIVAFWDGKSRGTKFVIEYAKRRRKNITIIT